MPFNILPTDRVLVSGQLPISVVSAGDRKDPYIMVHALNETSRLCRKKCLYKVLGFAKHYNAVSKEQILAAHADKWRLLEWIKGQAIEEDVSLELRIIERCLIRAKQVLGNDIMRADYDLNKNSFDDCHRCLLFARVKKQLVKLAHVDAIRARDELGRDLERKRDELTLVQTIYREKLNEIKEARKTAPR